MSGRFTGKVVLVSGGASGIGLATAQAFAAEGASVVIADVCDEGARAAAEDIATSRGKATAFAGDLRDYAACLGMVDHAMQAFGALHVAVNNAGVSDMPYGDFAEIDLADWDRVIGTNLGAMIRAMKAQVPALRRSGGGAIVNTASAAAVSAGAGKAAYVASKHAVAGLTKAAALDLVRHGIRVNAVCPGLTETPMVASALGQAELRAAITGMTPIGRMARAEEVARTILFLASDDASYITGSLLMVDGGLTAG